MAQSTIRISIRVEKNDKQAVINCITALPTGIKLSSHRELKKTYRFTFLVTRYQLLNKLFTSIRKEVKSKYSFMPRNKKKLVSEPKLKKLSAAEVNIIARMQAGEAFTEVLSNGELRTLKSLVKKGAVKFDDSIKRYELTNKTTKQWENQSVKSI